MVEFLAGAGAVYFGIGSWVASLNYVALRPYFLPGTIRAAAWLTCLAVWPFDVYEALRAKRQIAEDRGHVGEMFPGE